MFSAPTRSYCVLGPWRALSPRVGPLLKYFFVFLALCQQPVPSRAFPSLLGPTQDVHSVRSSPVFVRQTDLNTLSVLCGLRRRRWRRRSADSEWATAYCLSSAGPCCSLSQAAVLCYYWKSSLCVFPSETPRAALMCQTPHGNQMFIERHYFGWMCFLGASKNIVEAAEKKPPSYCETVEEIRDAILEHRPGSDRALDNTYYYDSQSLHFGPNMDFSLTALF